MEAYTIYVWQWRGFVPEVDTVIGDSKVIVDRQVDRRLEQGEHTNHGKDTVGNLLWIARRYA
jgi:hypothetical protein